MRGRHTKKEFNRQYTVVIVGTVQIVLVDQILLDDVVDCLVHDGVHPEANRSGDAMHECESRNETFCHFVLITVYRGHSNNT